jgi:hypothetical protein
MGDGARIMGYASTTLYPSPHDRGTRPVTRWPPLRRRLYPAPLPDPAWAHGKKAIVEPDRKLTAQETKERVCEHYHCELLEPLEQGVA